MKSRDAALIKRLSVSSSNSSNSGSDSPISPSSRNDKIKSISTSRSIKSIHADHRDSTSIKISGANVDTQHQYSKEEATVIFSYINSMLSNDSLCSRHLPFDIDQQDDIFSKLGDGIILMRLINLIHTGAINEKKFNKQEKLSIYQKQENLNAVIAGANKIGAHVVNIGGQDILAGRPTIILGLIWQILKIQLLSEVSIETHPEVYVLKNDEDTDESFSKITKEEILLRWVNKHLKNDASSDHEVKNFDIDMKNPVVLCRLLNQIDSTVCVAPYGERGTVTTTGAGAMTDLEAAQCAINGAAKLGVKTFHTAADLCSDDPSLKVSFVARVFNAHDGMKSELTEIERMLVRVAAAEAAAEEEAEHRRTAELEEHNRIIAEKGRVENEADATASAETTEAIEAEVLIDTLAVSTATSCMPSSSSSSLGRRSMIVDMHSQSESQSQALSSMTSQCTSVTAQNRDSSSDSLDASGVNGREDVAPVTVVEVEVAVSDSVALVGVDSVAVSIPSSLASSSPSTTTHAAAAAVAAAPNAALLSPASEPATVITKECEAPPSPLKQHQLPAVTVSVTLSQENEFCSELNVQQRKRLEDDSNNLLTSQQSVERSSGSVGAVTAAAAATGGVDSSAGGSTQTNEGADLLTESIRELMRLCCCFQPVTKIRTE